jgi:uncharacterized Zn-finger protein
LFLALRQARDEGIIRNLILSLSKDEAARTRLRGSRPWVSSAHPHGQRAAGGAKVVADDEPHVATPDAPETVEVDSTRVACDGGGALGHPRVFLTLVDGVAECGYCDRRFVLKPGAKPRHAH